MNIDERIRAAVLPIVPICEPNFYDGEESTYCTFTMTELPTAHGDDAPHLLHYLIQLHFFAPGGKMPPSTRQTRWELCRAVLNAGFTYPSVTNANEKEWQHYVLEFEGCDGGV